MKRASNPRLASVGLTALLLIGGTATGGAAQGIKILPLNGAYGSIPANQTTFQFVGPPPKVTISATQRITASASLPMAAANPDRTVDFDICYRKSPSPLVNTGGAKRYQVAHLDLNFSVVATSATFKPGAAGSYLVGFCVRNKNSDSLIYDVLRGFVQITN